MSDTIRSAFEGVRDVNVPRAHGVVDLLMREAPVEAQTDAEIDFLFGQVILDESYHATPDDLAQTQVYDPFGSA